MPRANIDYSVLGIPKPSGKKRKPLRVTGTLRTYKPLSPRNEERHAARHEELFGEQAAACRTLPCAACGWTPGAFQQCDPHHEPPVSLGGTDRDAVPLGPSPAREGRGWGCGCHEKRHETTAEEFWSDVCLDPEDVKEGVREWMSSPAYLATHRRSA
jgi:hypothetical protein